MATRIAKNERENFAEDNQADGKKLLKGKQEANKGSISTTWCQGLIKGTQG